MVNFFLPCREDSLRESVKQSCFSFLVISGIAFLTSYGQLTLLLLTSQRQALKIRKLYLRSLFRQEMGWYDLNDSGELVTHIAKSVLLLFNSFSRNNHNNTGLTLSLSGFALCFAVMCC